MVYIGIDLGTSAVKILLLNEKGDILKSVSKEYPLYFPHPGWSEQDPADWWKMCCEGLNELLCGTDTSMVGGIGVAGQMHGLVILDKDDNVIRPAILWNDGRTSAETDYLNNDIGKSRLSHLTGNIAFAGFTAPKILWVKENEPGNFEKIEKIMLPKDYIVYKLTGAFTCDYSDASGMLLLDVEHKCWSDEMCEICHVKKEQLPKLHESFETAGRVTKEAAGITGLPEGIPVAAGAGDNAAAAVGTGTVGNGKCNLSLGTSGTLFISSDSFSVDDNNALHAFAHADGGYHLMGCMLSAASCYKWWMEEILKETDVAEIQKSMKASGENNVFFLPYLMGERSPHNDPFARGAFIGMSMDTTREDMTLSVLEGVMFGVRDMLEAARSVGVEPKRTYICGGGAKSLLWKHIAANVLNMKVDVPACEEGPGMGAAMLAMVAAGEYASVEEAVASITSVRETIEPDPEAVNKYNEKYLRFRKYYPALKNLFTI